MEIKMKFRFLSLLVALGMIAHGQAYGQEAVKSADPSMPAAMGQITFNYFMDAHGLKKMVPVEHKMMINEKNPMTVDQHKDLVQKALSTHSKTETLFSPGEMFGKAKAEAQKAVQSTTKMMTNKEFQKGFAKAFAGAVAVGAVVGGGALYVGDKLFNKGRPGSSTEYHHPKDEAGPKFDDDENKNILD